MSKSTQNSDRTANLTPWKPGQSGNPGGRPKRSVITDILKEQLDKPIPASMVAKLPPLFVEVYGDNPTFGDMLAFKMVQMAAKGDMFAMNSILDRVEGKPVQGIKHSGDEEKSVAFKVEIVHVGRVFEDV